MQTATLAACWNYLRIGGNLLDGSQLLDSCETQLRRFTIQQSNEAYWAIALYVAYTHASQCFQFAPRLIFTSAEKRSGKTRSMEIASALARDPLVAVNATVPAIFRSLGQSERPRTLVLDEVDTIFGTRTKAEQNEDLRGLLNAGFQRGTPVLRTVGPNHEPTEFQTFAPAIMAGIGNMPDTIVDRAVNIRLRRRKNTETVEPYRIRLHEPGLHELRQALTEWIQDNENQLLDVIPENPLQDRAADLWEPLLAVADLAGGQWPIKARQAARKLAGDAAEEDQHQSDGVELLADIRQVLAFQRGDHVQSSVLLSALKGIEDSRWMEDGLSGRRLADLLKPYQVVPVRLSGGKGNGYKVERLQDAFARYLPAETPEPTQVPRSA